MSAQHLTIEDATTWWQAGDDRAFIADVLDSSNGPSMSVGFARYDKGATNEWVLTYDKTLVVTKGVLTVRTGERVITARAGEAIFLTKGTKVVYEGGEDGTEIVYVTFPRWWNVHRESEHAHLLAKFRAVRGATRLMSRARPPVRSKASATRR